MPNYWEVLAELTDDSVETLGTFYSKNEAVDAAAKFALTQKWDVTSAIHVMECKTIFTFTGNSRS